MKKTRILFFLAGPVATADETAKAAALVSQTQNVVYRNASAVGEGDAVEIADGYAGKVPAIYRGRAPIVDEALPVETPAPAPVVATQEAAPTNPPEFVPPAAAATAAAQPDAEAAKAAQRAAEDEGAKNATAAQLKAALDQLGIKYAKNASKADLLALFLNR